MLLYPAEEPPETFYPYQLYDGGVGKKQWRDLRLRDAFEETVVTPLADHAVGSELAAVRNGDVYRGGYLDQGPIINLFQTERAARRIFADEFSEDELFDRQRLADIVLGNA